MRALNPKRVAEASPEPFLGLVLVAGMAASLLVGVLVAWLASAMMAGTTVGLDQSFRDGIHALASPGATVVMRAASRLGSPPVVTALAVVAAIGFIRSGSRRPALLLLIAVAGGGLLSTALKNGFRRTRPSPLFDYPLPDSYSFPSGHAVWSFCLFAVLAALISRRTESRMRRFAVWAAAAGVILLIGVSRVYLGVHHASDVLAGWGAAFVWVTAVAFGDRVANRVRQRRRA